MKRHLTKTEEFDIMKIVLDKFLLLGVFLLGYGLWKIIESPDFLIGLSILLSGVVIMVLFTILMVKEYEFIKM